MQRINYAGLREEIAGLLEGDHHQHWIGLRPDDQNCWAVMALESGTEAAAQDFQRWCAGVE